MFVGKVGVGVVGGEEGKSNKHCLLSFFILRSIVTDIFMSRAFRLMPCCLGQLSHLTVNLYPV